MWGLINKALAPGSTHWSCPCGPGQVPWPVMWSLVTPPGSGLELCTKVGLLLLWGGSPVEMEHLGDYCRLAAP